MVEVVPIVRRKLRDGRIITREGRGFSVNELREAAVSYTHLTLPTTERV